MRDLKNQKFGKLTVIEKCNKDKYHRNQWLCQCECGNKKIILEQSLLSGATKSCGCLQKNIVKNFAKLNFTKHSQSKTRIYNIWCNIKSRCYNKNNNRYYCYGAKGITVCQEWRDNFSNFYNWAINNGYKENLTIDRIDVNSNYDPSNCRWVDYKTQANNKSNNHYITYNGETHSLSEWARIKNIKVSTLSMRLNTFYWTLERALG